MSRVLFTAGAAEVLNKQGAAGLGETSGQCGGIVMMIGCCWWRTLQTSVVTLHPAMQWFLLSNASVCDLQQSVTVYSSVVLSVVLKIPPTICCSLFATVCVNIACLHNLKQLGQMVVGLGLPHEIMKTLHGNFKFGGLIVLQIKHMNVEC